MTASGSAVTASARAAGVRVFGRDSWNARQTRWLRAYFRNEIMPVLSPLGLDPAPASTPDDLARALRTASDRQAAALKAVGFKPE